MSLDIVNAILNGNPQMELILFSEVPKYLPKKKGKYLHPSSVYRWSDRGCKAIDGRSVHLKFIRLGGTRATTAQWLQDFFQELALSRDDFFAEKQRQHCKKQLLNIEQELDTEWENL